MLRGLSSELGQQARRLVQEALRRGDLVTREEFEAQCVLLAKTRLKLIELENELKSVLSSIDPPR